MRRCVAGLCPRDPGLAGRMTGRSFIFRNMAWHMGTSAWAQLLGGGGADPLAGTEVLIGQS